MKNKAAQIYFLVDRSGSMASRWDETLGAINSYAGKLAKEKGMKKAKLFLAVFDGSGGLEFDVLRDGVDASKWTDLSPDEASPRGMTPLFDAIGKLSTIVEKDAPKKAVIAVVTDGHENASRESTRESAKANFDRMRDKGYQVVFLGADFDAFGQAASVGTAVNQTINMKTGNYGKVMRRMAAATADYAATDSDIEWSDKDRQEASQ
jgi:hypothetical protein